MAGHLPCVACGLCGKGKAVAKSPRLAAFESSSLKSIVLKGLGVLCDTTCKDLKQIFFAYVSAASLKCMSCDLCIHELLPLLISMWEKLYIKRSLCNGYLGTN